MWLFWNSLKIHHYRYRYYFRNISEVHFALHHPLFFQLRKWAYEKGELTDFIIVIEIFEFRSLLVRDTLKSCHAHQPQAFPSSLPSPPSLPSSPFCDIL